MSPYIEYNKAGYLLLFGPFSHVLLQTSVSRGKPRDAGSGNSCSLHANPVCSLSDRYNRVVVHPYRARVSVVEAVGVGGTERADICATRHSALVIICLLPEGR